MLYFHPTNKILANERKIMKKYLKLRKQYEFLIYNGVIFLMILVVALSKSSIYYVAGFIFFIFLVESIVVKCPFCKKKPSNLFGKFPQKCPHCGKEFLDMD